MPTFASNFRLFIGLIPACLLVAQSYTGSIAGRVTDGSGLPVPKAQIVVTEESTNTSITTESNKSGDYNVSYLKPGAWKVTFKAAGFKEHAESGVQLQINQQRRVDPVLEVGQVTEVVQVTASGLQVNYVSPEIGHVVDAEQLVELPLISTNSRGRSPFLLAKLVPGVTSNGNSYTNINGFSFAGGRRVTNEILVDGLPTTNPSDQTYTLTPSPDAIQEFKVITTPFSAEYGHTGGGVMIATSRAGSNALHGSAYELFRNRVLNGRNFFSPLPSRTKYVQNDPGGTIGGPVVLPRLYDGRNKTFFFIDFNVTLASSGTGFSSLVPTEAQKTGDFSRTLAAGRVIPVYDPKALAADRRTRLQFANNAIPASRIDPVAAQILKFYPSANADINGLNYFTTPPATNDVWQHMGRIDQNFGSNDRAFFRFGQYSPNNNAVPYVPNRANNQTAGGWTDTQAVMSETHIFGPTLVSDFRFGMVEEGNYSTAGGAGAAVPELGLKGVALTEFPTVAVSQMIQLGSGASNHDRNRSWVFSEGLTWQRNRHTVKVGGDFRRQMYNNYSPGKLPGSYSFTGAFSSVTPNATGSGFGLADLILGAPATSTLNINDYTYRLNINSAGAFFQDDFKILNNLTLNFGVRWEWDGPYSEANNQFASFNPQITNKATGTLGDVQFAGRNGAPRHFTPNVFYNFLPRVGFAWNVLPRTVLRGGYGVYRLPAIGYSGTGPVSQYAQVLSSVSVDGNQTPPYYLQDGVPAPVRNVDANGNPNIPASLTRATNNVSQLELRSRTPYNQTWQLGIQRQFPGNWMLEVDYVGTRGVKLPVNLPRNQLPANLWGAGNLQALRPYPQYLNVTNLALDSNSFYNALQTSLQRRWKDGVIGVSYSWAKVTVDVDGPQTSSPIQNVYNLPAEHGIASYDVPHRFVANFVYRLPIGAGGRFLNNIPVLKNVLGGWEISGVAEYQVGVPMSVAQANNTGGFTGTQRPNQIARAALDGDQRTLARWFNTEAFTVAPAFTSGNAPRFPLYGPGIENWDSSLMRNVMFREGLRLQFRAEFYNVMNHPNFRNPNTTLGNVNYGRITADNGARNTELALRLFW